MAVCRETPDISYPPQPSEDTHDVMWLVKRQAYELVFTTPNSLHPLSHGEQPRLHVRCKAQRHTATFALHLEDLNHFYEDLLCMMEYVQSERQKLRRSEPA
jgi:hypothetical protein